MITDNDNLTILGTSKSYIHELEISTNICYDVYLTDCEFISDTGKVISCRGYVRAITDTLVFDTYVRFKQFKFKGSGRKSNYVDLNDKFKKDLLNHVVLLTGGTIKES